MTITQFLFSISGRIPRSALWLKFYIPYILIFILMIGVDVATGQFNQETGGGLFSSIFMLVAIYPSIAISVKRLHDRNRSGWFLLLGIIPIVNIWIAIELWFLKGTDGDNNYGADPLTS